MKSEAAKELKPCPFCGNKAESDSSGITKCYDPSCGVWQPTVELWNTRYEAARHAPADEEVSMPLCAGHGRVDRMGHLVLAVGNNCVACSLNERTELLGLLTPFIPSGGADSVTTLSALIAAVSDEKETK